MKKSILVLSLLFVSIISAQSKYQKECKSFSLWEEGKMTESSQLFERISKAEPTKWLPPYYAATVEILSSFGLKDETVLKAKLTKAQDFLDIAKSNSENNPEIIITQALLNLGYIAFDGQKIRNDFIRKNESTLRKSIGNITKNPRVILGNAEWNMGSAKFFGKSTKPYCDEIKRAIELGKKEKTQKEFYPKFMLSRAEQVLKQCEK